MLTGLVGTKEEQARKIIKKHCGYYLFFYYQYVDNFKCKPVSFDDLINGLLFIQAVGKLKELK